MRFLLPWADRANVINAGITALDAYYTRVIDAYNDWTGLSDSPASPLNQNVANRYFIKADKHGVGAAYYLPWWCAQTAATLSQGWIDNVATQWTILHEIGHGYQGVFMNDVDLPVGEMWNNIYAAFFQQLNLNQGTIFIPTAGSMITGGSLSRNCNSLPICGIARRLAPGASDPVCNF